MGSPIGLPFPANKRQGTQVWQPFLSVSGQGPREAEPCVWERAFSQQQDWASSRLRLWLGSVVDIGVKIQCLPMPLRRRLKGKSLWRRWDVFLHDGSAIAELLALRAQATFLPPRLLGLSQPSKPLPLSASRNAPYLMASYWCISGSRER